VSQHLPRTGDVQHAGAGGDEKPDPLWSTTHALRLAAVGLKCNIIVL
jgi:hypothetical protein